MIHGNVIFDILESHDFENIAYVGSFNHFVFVYLRISHLIHGNVITDILESYAFQKYSTCWVIQALCICVIAYLGIFVIAYFPFDTRECHIRYT